MSVYSVSATSLPPRTDHDLYRCGRFTARPEFVLLGLVGAWEGSVVCLSNWSFPSCHGSNVRIFCLRQSIQISYFTRVWVGIKPWQLSCTKSKRSFILSH